MHSAAFLFGLTSAKDTAHDVRLNMDVSSWII